MSYTLCEKHVTRFIWFLPEAAWQAIGIVVCYDCANIIDEPCVLTVATLSTRSLAIAGMPALSGVDPFLKDSHNMRFSLFYT